MCSRSAVWIVAFALLLVCVNSLQLAEPCDEKNCTLPKCKCSTVESGSAIPVAKIPQIIMSSFDDAVTRITYAKFAEALFNRTNPDGCPIAVTHFLSHEYTDYTLVHELFKKGHEIALHSVTHNSYVDNYWRNISLSQFKKEFGVMRTMANYFGGIPEQDIHGMRLPFLQTSGNVSFQGLEELGLKYDSSLPTRKYIHPALWPYTLAYESRQDCAIEPCRTASFPNTWEVPMVMWHDEKDIPCSMVDACVNIPTDAPSITKWIIKNFERHYHGNRAPFPIFMHAAWFLKNPENYKAYASFIDYVQKFDDVYIVSVNKTIEWIKNPKPLDVADKKPFGACTVNVPTFDCVPLNCGLKTESGEEKWINSCVKKCPNAYPWLDNPHGD